jgi:hypothetical protein
MRQRSSQGIHAALLVACALAFGCDKAEPLTAAKATEIIGRYQFHAEPVYAEVPQRVWWSPKAPKDDYDEKALRTLTTLQQAGYVTVTGSQTGDSGEYVAKVTQKGFNILGTAPSARGPVFRARICEKKYDGIRNFERHPSDPTVGHAELVWHYDNPTPLYPMFETKINKPLKRPFASFVAFYFKDHEWRFDVTVRKAEV